MPWRQVSGRSQGNMAPCRWRLQQLRRAEAEGPQRRNRHGSNSRNPSNRSIRAKNLHRWVFLLGEQMGEDSGWFFWMMSFCMIRWIVWSVWEGKIEVLELARLLAWQLGGHPWCLGHVVVLSWWHYDGNDGSDDMVMLVVCLRVLEWAVGSNWVVFKLHHWFRFEGFETFWVEVWTKKTPEKSVQMAFLADNKTYSSSIWSTPPWQVKIHSIETPPSIATLPFHKQMFWLNSAGTYRFKTTPNPSLPLNDATPPVVFSTPTCQP